MALALRDGPDPQEADPTILVVDDDPTLLRTYARHLEAENLRVERAADAQSAIKILRTGLVDVVVSDVRMPGMDGIELLQLVRSIDPDMPVILVTASPEIESAAAAVEHGAFRYLCKPLDLDGLLGHIQKAQQVRRFASIQRLTSEYLSSQRPSETRLALEGAFQRALATLWMAHQPIVRAAERKVVAYEALLRSREPTVPHPGAFLDTAKRVGATRQLGRTIRAAVAKAAANLPEGCSIFVNVSAAELGDDELLDPAAPLSAYARRCVLEITERAPLDRVDDVRARIATLRSLGFRVALDDLGAGYASLNSFALLEPDVVKLDMSLVRSCDADPTKRKLIASIVTLCRELRITTVCEGVETVAEKGVLEGLGCDLLQGYLFAKPAEGFPEPRW
jgi:EAL domain-containing protein (putative c-di-GMP-specific phosphodiesterase class I)